MTGNYALPNGRPRLLLHHGKHLGQRQKLHTVTLAVAASYALKPAVSNKAIVVRDPPRYDKFRLQRYTHRAPILSSVAGSTFVAINRGRVSPGQRLEYSREQRSDNAKEGHPVQVHCPSTVFQISEKLIPVDSGQNYRLGSVFSLVLLGLTGIVLLRHALHLNGPINGAA